MFNAQIIFLIYVSFPHNIYNVCIMDGIRDFRRSPKVYGPGGILLPTYEELDSLTDLNGDSITVMCFTWNIAEKVQF